MVKVQRTINQTEKWTEKMQLKHSFLSDQAHASLVLSV